MTTTTTQRSHTDRPPSTPRHTRRTEMTERPTGRAEQGGDNPMQLTELLDLHEASVTRVSSARNPAKGTVRPWSERNVPA